MTTEKAFEWLFSRFGNKTITPCKFDVECLKHIAEWVNRETEGNTMDNILFAKLYCHVFIQEIKFYKDFEFAQRSMNDILKKPIEGHYEQFNQLLNDYELNRYFTSLGIDVEKRTFTDEFISDKYADVDKLGKANNEEFLKYAGGKWSFEQIRQSLNIQISESINRFKNFK